ncbi:MAG: hypothetical protein OQK12_03070 [Motiliproteus sp.]|nr:hypothetical protein [Motiliproteus sp.]
MKTFSKMTLATAVTAIALTAGVAQAGPGGYYYGINKIDYTNSFNTDRTTDVSIDRSQKFKADTRLNYDIDRSRSTEINRDYRLNYGLDYKIDNIKANQSLNQFRAYGSNVGQNAANVGGASGHSMNQTQGGTSVGSLVKGTSVSKRKGHNFLSPSYTSGFGSQSKGNMYGSHIGGSQSAMQMGNVVNAQNNAQSQNATSGVGSIDAVSNSAAK